MSFSPDQLLKDLGFPEGPNDRVGLEGYISESQKKQFCERLQEYPPLGSIAEIGLNVGHSAENFLQNCPSLRKFVSFDICFHSYTDFAAKYLEEQYKGLFQFVRGDSRKTVIEYAEKNLVEPFDLIYIDGDHRYEYCLADIANCAKISRKGTKLWIDDYNYNSVFLAVHKQEHRGLIKLINIHESCDPKAGERHWIEMEYL